ncbi:MAG TPA: hypothetical protein VK983_01960 [Candidatus Limnocylindrales bacterium]|nr:hypothetical protein [Candidatus Limnocylindrales bacterium]
MITLELIRWWYGPGWKLVYDHAIGRFERVSHLFSVPILVRTLWAPWRRIVTHPGASLEARMRAAGDNFVSRLVGFTVRMMVLVAAGVLLAGSVVLSGVFLVAWPLVPPLVVGLLVLAVLV